MKRSLLLIGFLLVTGCKKSPITAIMEHTSDPGLNNGIPRVVVVAGQSNAERLFNWAGMVGWQRELNAHDDIIGCGEDGSSIDDWSPTNSVMRRCLDQIGNREPDVVLWYQGESNATSGTAPGYTQKTVALFQFFRTKWPHVKIVFAQLHTVDPTRWGGFDAWDDIKQQQASLYLPNTIMVRTDDIHPGPLDPEGDGIHWAQAGYVLLGKRFAEGFKRLNLGD